MKRRTLALYFLLATGAVATTFYLGGRLPSQAVCDVNITSPVHDRAGTVVLRSSQSLTVTVSGTASRCPAAAVTVTRSENGGAETAIGTPTTSGAGAWSQAVTLTSGVSTAVFARMTLNGRVSQARVIFDANTALPLVTVAAPAGNDFGVLNVVAPREQTCTSSGGNIHVTAGEPGWVSDSDCGTAGGQVATSFTVTGAAGGTYDVSYAGSSLSSGAIAASPQTFTPTITLPDVTRGNLVFSATNGSGSTARTLLTRVLVSSPPALTGPDGGAPVLRLTNARKATVEMDYLLPIVPSNIGSASVDLLWSHQTAIGPHTATRTADGGVPFNSTCVGDVCWLSQYAPGGWAHTYDGGSVQFDAGSFDVGILVFGASPGAEQRFGESGHTRGLMVQIDDDCILYDPSESPQTWECRDSLGGMTTRLVSGSVRTATYPTLPPLNTYYLMPVIHY